MTNNLPVLTDGLQNVATGLNTEKSKRAHNRWHLDVFNNWQQLDAAYQSSWLARQVVDVPCQDMTREWRRIKSGWAEEIEAEEQRLNLQTIAEEACQWAALQGGSAILMLTGQDLSKPLDVNRVRKGDLRRLIVFDRWEMSPTVMNTWDVLAPNFLQPEWYTVRGGVQQIHHSHFARFIGEKLPRRLMEQLHGWGDSVLRKCLADIGDMVAAKDGIAELMQEANIDIVRREGLAEDLASDQDSAIIDRYALFSQMKSIINLALLDMDEEFDRKTLNLSGVAPIIETFMTWISGAARVPVTKLFGTSAKGLNATGEGDLKTYYDDIRAMQNSKLSVPLRQIDEVLVRSATGQWRDDFDYEWNPLQQINEVEAAQAELLQAQRDAVYLETGVVQKSQLMRNLMSNEVYQYDETQITELEELENPNMFETLPDYPDAVAPVPALAKEETFTDRYMKLMDGGLTHEQIMMVLDGE